MTQSQKVVMPVAIRSMISVVMIVSSVSSKLVVVNSCCPVRTQVMLLFRVVANFAVMQRLTLALSMPRHSFRKRVRCTLETTATTTATIAVRIAVSIAVSMAGMDTAAMAGTATTGVGMAVTGVAKVAVFTSILASKAPGKDLIRHCDNLKTTVSVSAFEQNHDAHHK